MTISKPTFSIFDRTIGLVIITLALIISLLIWRGEQIGLRVTSYSPVDGASDVPPSTEFRIRFNQPLQVTGQAVFTIDPPVAGSVVRDNTQLIFTPTSPLQPNTAYTITLAAEIESRTGKMLRRPLVWHFQTGQLRLLFLAPDPQGNHQIYLTAIGSADHQDLTRSSYGVIDYDVSSDGQSILYSARNEENGSDLWLLDIADAQPRRLLACDERDCTDPNWPPNDDLTRERIIYTRPDTAGPPRLWWFDANTQETTPVFDDEEVIGYAARWSVDGTWLSYLSPMEEGVRVFTPNDIQNLLLPTRLPSPAVWHPDQSSLLLRDMVSIDGRFVFQLFKVNLDTLETTNLTGEDTAEDGSPSWSPDGRWIAFGRTLTTEEAPQQIWLMRTDGTAAQALTNNPEAYHTTPAWSADSQYLAYQRNAQDDAQSGIWVIEVETGEERQISSSGRVPTWLP